MMIVLVSKQHKVT